MVKSDIQDNKEMQDIVQIKQKETKFTKMDKKEVNRHISMVDYPSI